MVDTDEAIRGCSCEGGLYFLCVDVDIVGEARISICEGALYFLCVGVDIVGGAGGCTCEGRLYHLCVAVCLTFATSVIPNLYINAEPYNIFLISCGAPPPRHTHLFYFTSFSIY